MLHVRDRGLASAIFGRYNITSEAILVRIFPYESVVMDPLYNHLQFQNRIQLSGREVKQTVLLQTVTRSSCVFFRRFGSANSVHLTIATSSNLLP